MSSTASSNPLYHPRYPRSTTYDPQWIFENQMGLNALWLMEALADVMPIKPRICVLDLGCGTAMTSIFIAKEFGAEVWATDLWVGASENQARVRQAAVEDLVVPIHAEAHRLPFAEGSFDAIVSVDAFQYFGTADLYLGYITRFLCAAQPADARLGVAVGQAGIGGDGRRSASRSATRRAWRTLAARSGVRSGEGAGASP